jgi:filamentous hemagglutinin
LGITALGGAGFRLLKRLSSRFRKSISGTPLAVCEMGCIQKMGGVEFEAYLNKIGLGHNFEVMGKQFDGFYGGRLVHEASIWIEAKAANYWDKAMGTPLKTRNMLSSFGHQQKLAMDYGKEFHLISGGPIPQLVKDWLEERGIRYFEAID